MSPKQKREETRVAKAQHTPGPWFADGQAGGTLAFAKKYGTALMIRGRNCTVAEVIPHGNATEANASLIAAAPDLKNEGSAAVSVIEDVLKWEPSISKSMRRQLENAASNLRAAIARARGESC